MIKAGFSPLQPNRLPWHFSANLPMQGVGWALPPCLPPALPVLALQEQTGDPGSWCCATRRLFLANRSYAGGKALRELCPALPETQLSAREQGCAVGEEGRQLSRSSWLPCPILRCLQPV